MTLAAGGCAGGDPGFGFIAHHGAKSDARPHPGVERALRYPVHGIDVSRWQGEIDWRAVRAAGTNFAFIKATEGGDHLDPRFHDNWRAARAAGVPRGAYHFVYWCRPAHEQAAWFVQNVPADPDALPPILDVEWNGHSRTCPRRVAPEVAREKMRVLLAAMERHTGKTPVIYTDIPFHRDVLEGVTEFDRHPYWIRSTAAPPEERYPGRAYAFWQWTTTGRVPGIRSDVDRNAFIGTPSEFRGWVEGRFDVARREWRSGTALAFAPPAASPVAAPSVPAAAPPAEKEQDTERMDAPLGPAAPPAR